MDRVAHRNTPALPDALRGIAGRHRGTGQPQSTRESRPQPRRARRHRGRHSLVRVCFPILRLSVTEPAGSQFDSRLRRGGGMLRIRLCARGRRLCAARRKFQPRAGGGSGRDLHDGRLDRPLDCGAVRRRRRRGGGGFGTGTAGSARQPAALVRRVVGSPDAARDRRAKSDRRRVRGALPTTRSRCAGRSCSKSPCEAWKR